MAAKKSKKNRRRYELESNYNARINSRPMRNENGIRTWTANRDYGSMRVSAVTSNTGATNLKIYGQDEVFVDLNGYEARTLFRVLQKHFGTTGRSTW